MKKKVYRERYAEPKVEIIKVEEKPKKVIKTKNSKKGEE